MKKLSLTIVLLLLTISFVFSQGTESKNDIANIIADELFHELTDQLASGKFYFEADWATSSTGERFNLFSNPNYLSLNQLHAKAKLPYFGTAHSIGFNVGGIKFDNEIQEYETKYSDKNERTTVSFTVKNKTENFDIVLTVYPNKNVTAIINSNYRSSISYTGRLVAKEEIN
jgi:hypothetical protein